MEKKAPEPEVTKSLALGSIRHEEFFCLNSNKTWFFWFRISAWTWQTQLWMWTVLTSSIMAINHKNQEKWGGMEHSCRKKKKRFYLKILLWFLSVVTEWSPSHGAGKGNGPDRQSSSTRTHFLYLAYCLILIIFLASQGQLSSLLNVKWENCLFSHVPKPSWKNGIFFPI